MKFKYLPKEFYKVYQKTAHITISSEEAYKRKKWLKDWEILKARGVSDQEIAQVTGISRATYYRLKKALALYGYRGLEARSKRPHKLRQSKIPQQVIETIISIRQSNPTYSKGKIAIILKRDYTITLSESSVGRILKNNGLITRYKHRKKSRRLFNKHAKRWLYGFKSSCPGELVQIDHMSVSKNQFHFKHFQAWDPLTKTIVAEIYSNANSLSAAKFLEKVKERLPFPLKSIQVDGGSEFMHHFEEACAKNNIKLFVLPPKRPQYNGGVERTNRTMREEFYEREDVLANSIPEMRTELEKVIHKHNYYRPHFSLHGLTPFEYTNILLNRSFQSHML